MTRNASIQLRNVETHLRVYRGVAVSSSTIDQLERHAATILHAMGIRDFQTPRIGGASLLRSSNFDKARRQSSNLREYTVEYIARSIDARLPKSSDESLSVSLREAYVLHTNEQPWRYDIAVDFAHDTFDEERNAVYETLGHLASQAVVMEGYPQIRLGWTRTEVPELAMQYLQNYLPRRIELEPTEITFFSCNNNR